MNASFAHPSPSTPQHPMRDYGRVLLGLVVMTLGVLFLLDGAGVLNADKAINHYWPAVLIAAAVFQFLEGTHGLFRPGVLLLAGTILILVTTHVISGNAWDYLWPTAIIVVGLHILSRRRVPRVRPPQTDDSIVASGIFGGPTIASGSRAFREASLTAVFGGVTLDLRSAQLAPEGAAITATAAFGGVEVLVPRGWRIVVKGTPIFGGIEDKTLHDAELAEEAPLLSVDGLALFGGIEVKHDE